MKLKIFNIRILSTCLIVLLGLACSKNPPIEPEPTEPVMPPLTHEGRNTFGCYIDGELFVANEGESVWSIPPVSGSFDEGTTKLVVQGTRYRNDLIPNTTVYDDIRLRANINSGLGSYDYEIYDGGIRGYTIMYANGCDYYYENIADLGRLTITYLDETKNIISGTFYMNLTNPDCPDDTLLQITDGRFDFRY